MLRPARFSVPLDNPRREAFCQALGAGATIAEATRAAGFGWRGHGLRIIDDPDIVGRLAWLRLRLAGGGSRDISAIIDGLIETALEARLAGSPQGAMTARASYETAAKLKLSLPPDPPPAESAERAAGPEAPVIPTDRRLTDEEWMALYGPEPPGGKPDWSPGGAA